jgi:hypothetical protein
MSYKNIVHKFTGNDGEIYVNTTERIHQHGSRFYMTLKVPPGYEVKQGQKIDDEILKDWQVMASTNSPYKKPLKTFKKNVTK